MDHETYTLAQWEALNQETKLEAVFDIAGNGFADDQFGTVEDQYGWNAIVTASGRNGDNHWMQSFVLNQNEEGFRTMKILYPSTQDEYYEYKRLYENSCVGEARISNSTRKAKIEERAYLKAFNAMTKEEQTEFLFRLGDRGWAENEWGSIDCIFGWNAFLTTRWGAQFVLIQYGHDRHALLRSECNEDILVLRRSMWNSMKTLAIQANSILVPPHSAAKETT